MEINRYLRKDQISKKGECPIEFRLTWHQRKIRWSANMRINPKYWDTRKQRIKIGPETVWMSDWNDRLDEIQRKALACLQGHLMKGEIPTEKQMKVWILEEVMGKKKEVVKEEVVVVVEKYNLDTVGGFWGAMIERIQSRYSEGYLSTFRAARILWYACFAEEEDSWGNLIQAKIEAYVSYMIEEGLSNGTIKVYLGRLGLVFDEAREAGFLVPVNMRKIKVDGYESMPVWLTMPEVQQVLNATYSSANLQIVADAFCFAIGTGLRFSDLVRISEKDLALEENSEGEMVGTYRMVMKKTGQIVVMNMTPLAVMLWKKYEGNPLKFYKGHKDTIVKKELIASSSYRSLLERVGKEAGLTAPTIKRWKVGKEWREETGPKWAFMTSHVARHTHAMIGLELGVRIEELQKGLGHTDIASTMRYARIAEGLASEKIREKWKGFNNKNDI
jgi:integrase